MTRWKMYLLSFALIAVALVATLHYSLLDGIPGLFFGATMKEDTVYAPGYSDEAFRRVRIGMTEQQVVELLGSAVRVRTDPYALSGSSGCSECWAYSYSPGDTDYRIRLICFRDRLVVAKKAEYWGD